MNYGRDKSLGDGCLIELCGVVGRIDNVLEEKGIDEIHGTAEERKRVCSGL